MEQIIWLNCAITLATSPFSDNPFWQVVVAGLQTGHSFPVVKHWGLIEEKITTELGAIWAEILTNPEVDLDTLIVKYLLTTAKWLNLIMGQQ